MSFVRFGESGPIAGLRFGQAASLMKLIEAIEELEDVQNVYMNGDIADEAIEG